MLAKYFWNLVLLAWVSSWRAANGLEGAVLAGILMVWPGVLTFVSGDTRWDKASNWAISFLLYAAIAWSALFILRFLLIAPYQLWKNESKKAENAKLKLVCSFDPCDRLCLIPLRLDDARLWFRAKVSIEGLGAARRCSARLVSIKKPDGSILPLELRLPFAPAEKNGLDPIDVVSGQPEHCDVISLAHDNSLKIINLPITLDQSETFRMKGRYELMIRVASESCLPAETTIPFLKGDDFQATYKGYEDVHGPTQA
jgi:hypothetical protein